MNTHDPGHPLHGRIHHLAYLADDLETTVERLVGKFRAGPFFVLRDVAFEHLSSRGEAATTVPRRSDTR